MMWCGNTPSGSVQSRFWGSNKAEQVSQIGGYGSIKAERVIQIGRYGSNRRNESNNRSDLYQGRKLSSFMAATVFNLYDYLPPAHHSAPPHRGNKGCDSMPPLTTPSHLPEKETEVNCTMATEGPYQIGGEKAGDCQLPKNGRVYTTSHPHLLLNM